MNSYRVSDLARTWAGLGTLEPRKFVAHHGVAEDIHEAKKLENIDSLAKELMDRYKFVSRTLNDVIIKGVIDGLRTVADYETGTIKFSLVEFKTVMDHVNPRVEDAAIFQLQTYIWIMKPILGERLHDKHYVEIVHRPTGRLMYRIGVKEDPYIEDKLWAMITEWRNSQ